MSPADEQDRAKAGELVAAVNRATGGSVQVVVADQGYTGEETATAVAEQGMQLQIVKLPQAKHGFAVLPRRWVVERSFAWLARFRRLARDYERLPALVAGLHVIAFTALLFHHYSAILSP